MTTSTSTPGSREMLVNCLTTSEGEWRSRILLWTLICHLSKVLVPSPQGDFLTIKRRTLVGMRTGPVTLSCFSRALFFNSAQTFSKALTLVEVRVMRMRWIGEASSTSVV